MLPDHRAMYVPSAKADSSSGPGDDNLVSSDYVKVNTPRGR